MTDERAATIKELNQLQVEMLEKIYDAQSTLHQDFSDFKAEVVTKIAELSTARVEEDRSADREMARRSQFILVLGVVASSTLSLFALGLSVFLHTHGG